jgi:hypothetical protein
MPPFNIGDWRNLTPDVITSLFLYGQLKPPTEIFDRITSSGPATVTLDAGAFMTSGPGRYATPALAPFVKQFFAWVQDPTHNQLPASLQNLSGTYSVQKLIAQYGINPTQFGFSFQQVNLDPSPTDPDYALRTYIYNTEKFVLSASSCLAGVPPV